MQVKQPCENYDFGLNILFEIFCSRLLDVMNNEIVVLVNILQYFCERIGWIN